MRRRISAGVAALACGLALVACTDDSSDKEGAAADEKSVTPGAEAETASSVAPQPESSVPQLPDEDTEDITVGGFVFEFDGVYLLCEAATESDPPDCEGESIEITNGDVIDPSIFVGEPGAQYSEAEVVMTGDIVDGSLVIG